MTRVGDGQRQGEAEVEPLLRAVARHWRGIVLTVLAAGLAAYIFTCGEPRLYRASALVELDMPKTATAAALAHEVEALRARPLVDRVAKRLALDDRPEFSREAKPFLGRLMRRIGLAAAGEPVGETEALRRVRERLDVHPVGSDRIAVDFSSEDPKLAAAMPNALSEEYLAGFSAPHDDGDMRGGFGQADDPLQREAELRQAEARLTRLESAGTAAVGVDAAQDRAATAARAAKTEAEQRVTRIRTALASQDAAAIAAAVDTPAADALAGEEEKVAAELADLSLTLLDKHPRIRALKAQQADLRQRLSSEAERALASAGKKTAQAGAATLAARDAGRTAADGKGASALAHDDARLQALRAEIAALQDRLAEDRAAATTGSIPSDGRAVAASIAARAKVPDSPYTPKTMLIVTAASSAAFVVAILVAVGGVLFGGRGRQSMAEPVAEEDDVPEVSAAGPAAADEAEDEPAGDDAPPEILLAPGDIREGAPSPVQFDAGLEPEAPEAEDEEPADTDFSVSAAALELLEQGAGRVVSVSPEGDEGSAVSVVLARLVAEQGLRTVLVDLTETAGPTRLMESRPGLAGLTDFLVDGVAAAETIQFDCASPAHFIPRGLSERPEGLEAAADFAHFVEALENAYDIVLIECGRRDAGAVRPLMRHDAARLIVTAVQPDEEALAAALADLYRAGLTRFRVMMPGLPYREEPGASRAA